MSFTLSIIVLVICLICLIVWQVHNHKMSAMRLDKQIKHYEEDKKRFDAWLKGFDKEDIT